MSGTTAAWHRLRYVAATVARLREQRLLIDSLLIGVAGAASALIFHFLLRFVQLVLLRGVAGYQAPALPAEGGSLQETIGPHGLLLIPVVTTLGGLLVGMLASWLAPETEGHGTDTVVRAFHESAGRLRARVAPIKTLASALTIGSGGAAGREGPVALIAAGVGSLFAQWQDRTDAERRVLLLVGMASGLAAIFRSPIGTAFFAIEVLYSGMEFESPALLYTMVGSITAYALSGIALGWQPLFQVPSAAPPQPAAYGWYALLGVGAGLVATAVPVIFYRTRGLFRALPIPPFVRPALGGLAVGLMALLAPQILGGGYGWVQEVIDGRLALELMILLLVLKPLALGFSVASGGSGGVFAPSLFTGAMLGGVFAVVFHQPAAAFAVVGMAAVFGGAAHVPFAALMMVIEMTGGYALLVAAAVAVTLSFVIQNRLSARLKYRSLYEAQVFNRAESPAHHAEHLEIALRILEQRKRPLPADVGRLNLVTLLQAGIPIDLPENRQLSVASLKDKSALVGTAPDEAGHIADGAELVGILRGPHMLPPTPKNTLTVGDRLVLLTTPEQREALSEHLSFGWR